MIEETKAKEEKIPPGGIGQDRPGDVTGQDKPKNKGGRPKGSRNRPRPDAKGEVLTLKVPLQSALDALPRWVEPFLQALSQRPVARDAAKASNISLRSIYDYARVHPEFARAWDEVIIVGHEAAVAEAYRRAVDGITVPIPLGDGKWVDHIKYSDDLLKLWLKANRPEYQDRTQVDITSGGQPLGSLDWAKIPPGDAVRLAQAYNLELPEHIREWADSIVDGESESINSGGID